MFLQKPDYLKMVILVNSVLIIITFIDIIEIIIPVLSLLEAECLYNNFAFQLIKLSNSTSVN